MPHLKQIARAVLDLFIFGVVCFTEFAISYWLRPSRRGFFCGDESLSYPLHANTIGVKTLIIAVLTVPSLVVLSVELFKRLDDAYNASAFKKTSCRVRHRLAACYKQLGCYLFGLALTLVATEVGKYSAGRLRPHFFAVCQPQLADGSSCADTKNHGLYIEHYNCRGDNMTTGMLTQVSLSFPSGHCSISFYAMVYVALYLQSALTTRASKLFKHLLQFACMMLAWFVALSRIADHWHHWSDVMAGSFLGTFIAAAVAIFIADLFVVARRNNSRTGMHHSLPKTTPKASTPTLPAYTFGSIPYLSNQYGQPYHNYGYVS